MTKDKSDIEFNDELRYLELKQMIEKADNAVAVAVATTATTCAVPIPFADAPMLVAQQVVLMSTICGVFEINIKKDGLKALAMAALSAGGATLVGKTIASNLPKLIPGLGSIAGGVISAGTAGVITLAMGKAFIEVCKAVRMGKLSEADVTSSKGVDMLKKGFKEQLRKKKE
ncbi:DUF697 domain-containing protein [Colidextribacter sp. 210702-DFI.3.9]|nr:DUF697 domain-containing protein [Colidextribacter sp. 210702-DFI.3.9]